MVVLEERGITQLLHIARTWYYLDIFQKITKWSQNILLSACNHVAHVSVLLLYSLFIYGFIVCVCVCVWLLNVLW